MDSSNDEVLFVGTADAEHVEMYLKAIWHIKERKEPVKNQYNCENAQRKTAKCCSNVKKIKWSTTCGI